MSVHDTSLTEDTEMPESDGDKVVTMMDVLQEQQDFEDDANAVLGASDDKECTYSKGYIKRQAVYACLTCCSEARDDPEKRAGVCLACSLNCHENHELIELYTKRNFCCDCGNPKFNSNPCQFTPNKTDLNVENVYNQNFSGLYCMCHRPYPDPDTEFEDEMIQCVICEDWLHSLHLETKVPSIDDYAEMICKGCMAKNEFLHDYSEFAVNIVENGHTVNGSTDSSHLNGNDDISVDVTNEITDQSINADESITEPSIAEKSIQEADGTADVRMKEVNEDASEKAGDIIEVKTLADNKEENVASSDANIESLAKNDDVPNESLPTHVEDETKVPEAESANVEESLDKKDVPVNNTENVIEPQTEATITKEERTSQKTEISSTATLTPAPTELPVELPLEANVEVPTKEDNSENQAEPEKKDKPEAEPVVESETKPEDDTKVEEANVENKLINSLETETAEKTAGESDIKPEEDLKLEDTTLESNQTDSKEEKADDLNLESNTETDKNVDTAAEEEKPETLTTEASDSKESNGDVAIDVIMAETDTSKTENTDVTINETEKDSLTVTTNKIENEPSLTDITDTPLSNGIEKENKRKLSTEGQVEESTIKKAKLDSDPNCTKPKNVKKVHKGATFWPGNFRQKLCKCNHCLTMYKDLSVLFLIDLEDTVSFYEALGKEKSNGTPTQYERGMEALSSLDRIQQINALTEYNLMRDKLLDFLKSFKERKEVVKEEDIKAFFAGMKPKREPDGVYFCR